MAILVLLRHGSSVANEGETFGGWEDAALSERGVARVQWWRRSYRDRPPPLASGNGRDSFGDARYRGLSRAQVPLAESLQETHARMLRAWDERILPVLGQGKNVLGAAHGNSIRALLMTIDGVTEEEIPALEVANGVSLVYRF